MVKVVKKSAVYSWSLGLLLFLVLLMMATPRVPQPQEYHDFADKRQFYGIPNTNDVVSNFPFLVTGLIGLVLCHHGDYFLISKQGEVWGWTVFFIGVTFVAFGSSYYHLNPNHDRLIFDRLPMVVAFVPITSIFVVERIDERIGTMSMMPLLVTSVTSVIYWRLFDDLRPYGLIQALPFVFALVMTFLLPPMYTHSAYWLWAIGLFVLAKVGEFGDRGIYRLTCETVSGHTLKHLFAAAAAGVLSLMLAKRDLQKDSVGKASARPGRLPRRGLKKKVDGKRAIPASNKLSC